MNASRLTRQRASERVSVLLLEFNGASSTISLKVFCILKYFPEHFHNWSLFERLLIVCALFLRKIMHVFRTEKVINRDANLASQLNELFLVNRRFLRAYFSLYNRLFC